MSKGGEVEMKSCFQSSDKQGESGGNRGKGGQVCRRGGGTPSTPPPPPLSQTYLIKTFPPQSPQYFQLLINPHPSAETGMSLGWELNSTHNCPISHRGGNCNCTCESWGEVWTEGVGNLHSAGFLLIQSFQLSPPSVSAHLFVHCPT